MKKTTILLSLLLLTICLIPVRASWVMPNPESAININDGYRNQIEFAGTDQYIVYTEYDNNTFYLYLYNIASGEKTLLAEQTSDKFEPSIDGHKVVWTTNNNGRKYITFYNIDEDSERMLISPLNYQHDTHPYIQGERISFIRWDLNSSDSYAVLYDLETSKLVYADGTRDGKQTNQRHFGQTIVWQDGRNGLAEIFKRDLSDEKNESINLSDNGLNHYFPKIYEQNVIWDTKNSVYAKNTNTTNLQIIGNESYANFYSSVSKNNVVYQSNRVGNYDIYLYNLNAKSEIKITTSYYNDESPSLYGDILTWRRQNDNGYYDVYYLNIRPALDKIYAQLNFESLTSSEVKITWTLADDYYTSANLYRSRIYNLNGDLIADHLTNREFIDNNLEPGQNYYYTLKPINKQGQESNWSEQYSYTASYQQLVKLNNSPTVYLIDENEAYTIGSADIFLAHGFSWSDIKTISQTSLDRYHYAGPLTYPDGYLIKTQEPTTYLIYDEIIRPFADEETFKRAGYKWSQVKLVNVNHLNIYQIGDELTVDNFYHPNGALIKYTYSPNVYLIENGQKRLISSEQLFNQYGFNWDQIITVPTYWEYPTGSNL